MTTDLTDAELDQLDQLEKNATPQPWCEDPEGAPPWFVVNGDPTTNAEAIACVNQTVDMALVVTVRRQLTRLIAEVRRRRAEENLANTFSARCRNCNGTGKIHNHGTTGGYLICLDCCGTGRRPNTETKP